MYIPRRTNLSKAKDESFWWLFIINMNVDLLPLSIGNGILE